MSQFSSDYWADVREVPFLGPWTAITIKGHKGFRESMLAALSRLSHTRTGADLLRMIAQHNLGHRITFYYLPGNTGQVDQRARDGRLVWGEEKRKVFQQGQGLSSTIPIDNDVENVARQLGWLDPFPLVIVVGHELIHALHAMWSQISSHCPFEDRGLAPNHEEARTTGLGPYADEWLTENRLRADLGIRRRDAY